MKRRVASRKPGATSSCASSPRSAAGAPGSPAVTISRISPMPSSPESASAPRLTSFAPVYGFGLCDAVHISPPARSCEPTV